MIGSTWKINEVKKLSFSEYCLSYKRFVKRLLISALYLERLKISMTHALFKPKSFQLC